MKVSIIGTHGIGKTHLINEVRGALREQNIYPPYIKERARELIETYGVVWQTLPPEAYNSMQLSLYYYYDYAFRVNKMFLSDRCHLDCIAYAMTRKLDCVNQMWDHFELIKPLYDDVKLYFYKGAEGDDIQSNLEALLIRFKLPHIVFTRHHYDPVLKDIVKQFTPVSEEEVKECFNKATVKLDW